MNIWLCQYEKIYWLFKITFVQQLAPKSTLKSKALQTKHFSQILFRRIGSLSRKITFYFLKEHGCNFRTIKPSFHNSTVKTNELQNTHLKDIQIGVITVIIIGIPYKGDNCYQLDINMYYCKIAYLNKLESSISQSFFILLWNYT